MPSLTCAISLFAFLLLSVLGAPSSNCRPTVTIDSGVVIGTATNLPGSAVKVNQYLGVPFAAPPVRFSRAVSPTPWTTAFDASKLGPACPQLLPGAGALSSTSNGASSIAPLLTPPAGESEDCLNVNIYVPDTPTKNKTVMFWIFGGAFTIGFNSAPEYDGTSFAANQDVILVSINYRLNIFGFPGSPQLPLTENNLGFYDQRLGLDWVQRNIAAFGGDPTKVLIFGESAGAASVDELVTTWPNNPPFRAAITESGQTSISDGQSTYPNSWNSAIDAFNCSTAADILACVRAIDFKTIISTLSGLTLTFNPIADNVTSLRYPEAARRAGNIARVPTLTGTNAEEFSIFIEGQNNTNQTLDAYFAGQPALIEALIAAYPIGSPGINDDFEQSVAILTDFGFKCPAGIASNDSANAGIPSYRYLYNATFPNLQDFPEERVAHGSELSIVFGTYPVTNDTVGEALLSAFIQTTWANFAKNPYAGPGWKEVPNVGVLGSPGEPFRTDIAAGVLDKNCYFFAPIWAALSG